jgi:hypothetical protein
MESIRPLSFPLENGKMETDLVFDISLFLGGSYEPF